MLGERLGKSQVVFAAGGVEDALCAGFERCFELTLTLAHHLCGEVDVTDYRYDFGRLVVESMRQVLVEGDEMRNVNVAVVLLGQDILPYLITVHTYQQGTL